MIKNNVNSLFYLYIVSHLYLRAEPTELRGRITPVLTCVNDITSFLHASLCVCCSADIRMGSGASVSEGLRSEAPETQPEPCQFPTPVERRCSTLQVKVCSVFLSQSTRGAHEA